MLSVDCKLKPVVSMLTGYLSLANHQGPLKILVCLEVYFLICFSLNFCIKQSIIFLPLLYIPEYVYSHFFVSAILFAVTNTVVDDCNWSV